MNDIIFSNSFIFLEIIYDKFHYTDNRAGAPSHYFAYLHSGSCKIVTESQTVQVHEGDIFYIPDKCSYQSYWYGDPEIKFVSLGFSYMPSFDNKTYPPQVIEHNDTAVEHLCKLSKLKQLTARDIGLFYTLAGILLPLMSHNDISKTKEIVERTEKYLLKHPHARAAELAKNCAVSEAMLYLAFQKSANVTPSQLRNRILLEKARDMLIATDKSIEFISDVLEFSSTSYFRKKFKEYFNMTPKEMRQKHKI